MIPLLTLLPHPTIHDSVQCLDTRTLSLQCISCYKIAFSLGRPTYPYKSEPGVIMWKNYRPALFSYAHKACDELARRGIRNGIKKHLLLKEGTRIVIPDFVSDPRLNQSHRQLLWANVPEFYSKYNWDTTTDNLIYYPI